MKTELLRQAQSIAGDPALQASDGDGARTVRHVFEAPGKHLRPALLLLSSRAAQRPGAADLPQRALIELAAAAELLHTASLVHDDVIDEAALRRGRASLNSRYSNSIAVLVGDLLYTQFFRIASGLSGVCPELKLRLLELFTSVTRRMCLGELAEERLRRAGAAADLDGYLAIIDGKTASLISGCCLAGALLGGADETSVQVLADYGRLLGLAYQLMDDLLDGDSVFPCPETIRRKLRECASEARAAVGSLAPNPAAERLDRFARAILDRVVLRSPG